MGLDVSHDCFSGAYSAFNRLRGWVAEACGGSWPPHAADFLDEDGSTPEPDRWYWDSKIVPAEVMAGMSVFMSHSDCDGEIVPVDAVEVAKFLRWVASAGPDDHGTGHLKGSMRAHVLRFANGCEMAAAVGDSVEFR